MAYIWHQLQAAWPLIWISGGYVQHVALVTIRIALVSTFWAVLLGLPAGLALGLGRFRGRRTLHVLANVSLGIPPVLVGIFVLLLLMQGGVFGGLRSLYTLRAVYIAQTLLALPYVVALSAAAVQGLPPGCSRRRAHSGPAALSSRLWHCGRREIGVIAAVIAALASTLTEVAAVIIVGANILGADQTLGSAIVDQLDNYDSIPSALALGIVLLALIFVLIGVAHSAAAARAHPSAVEVGVAMRLLWDELRTAVPLIFHGNQYMGSTIWFTVQVAFISTAIATVVGLPLAVLIGLGRFRGRALLQWIANACIALPPVLVGLFLFMLFIPQGPLGDSRLGGTRRSVFIAQAILATPYVVALGAAAIQSLPPGLLVQARALGAGRRQLAVLALREARIGVDRRDYRCDGRHPGRGRRDHRRRRQHLGLRPDPRERCPVRRQCRAVRRRGRLRDRADRPDARPARRHSLLQHRSGPTAVALPRPART